MRPSCFSSVGFWRVDGMYIGVKETAREIERQGPFQGKMRRLRLQGANGESGRAEGQGAGLAGSELKTKHITWY